MSDLGEGLLVAGIKAFVTAFFGWLFLREVRRIDRIEEKCVKSEDCDDKHEEVEKRFVSGTTNFTHIENELRRVGNNLEATQVQSLIMSQALIEIGKNSGVNMSPVEDLNHQLRKTLLRWEDE
ncbi:MAG: hypothetical protein AB1896_20455 [Thermodesulfobacteriota bacterium]